MSKNEEHQDGSDPERPARENSVSEPAKRPRRRRIGGSIVVAAVLAIAAAGWIVSGNLPPGFLNTASDATGVPVPGDDQAATDGAAPAGEAAGSARAPSGTTASAQAEAPETTVRVFDSVARERQSTLRIAGQTEASRHAVIRAETAGRITAIEIDEGDAVEEGELLARIDMDDREARLAEAKSRVEQRRIEYEAASKLAQKGFQSEVRRSEAKALLDAAKAALRRIETEIADTRITAPFDGIVYRKSVELGDFAGIGDTVAELVDLDPILVVASLSEREIGNIELGDIARADLITGESVSGIISYIAPSADKQTRTFRVEIEVSDTGNSIKEGVTADVRLPISRAKAHLISPALLTLADDGTVGVKAVQEDDTVRFMPVRVVEDTAEGMWVAGLPDEVTLISVGQEYVVQGERVQSVPDTALMPSTLRAAGLEEKPS